jgi:hypothetical protein
MTAPKQAFHFALQFGQGSIQRLSPRIDDYGPLRAQFFEMKADGLADAPLDTVAQDRFPKGTRQREADARSRSGRLAQTESRKKRPRKADAFVVDSPEILRSQQTDTFGKTRTGRGVSRGALGARHLPLRADSEFFPASGATPRQDRTAVLGFHPAAKTVGLGTMAIVRLKSTFWHFSSST